MNVHVFPTPDETARAVALRVAEVVRAKPDAALGLPAGRTPISMYRELQQMHARGELDFAHVQTFNLDEFAGVRADHPGSFRRFMDEHLFRGINIAPSRIGFLDGAAADPDAECERYEDAIEAAGGIDLQILGIGANGHIGFNEPGDELVARTHRVRLHDVTRQDNASLFGGDAGDVPREALSMGMSTILMARAIALIATGGRKAASVRAMVRGPLTTRWPASFLQTHRAVDVFLDRDAARQL